MTNEAIKEKLGILKEIFKWSLTIMTLSLAGAATMITNLFTKEEPIYGVLLFVSLVGMFASVGLSRKTWMDMEKYIKDIK